MVKIGDKQLNIGMGALIFYIAMMYVATDIYIPSKLCTVAIGILIIISFYIVIYQNRCLIVKNDYGYFFRYFLFAGFCIITIFYSNHVEFMGDSIYLVYVTLAIVFCVSTVVLSYENIVQIFEAFAISSIIQFVILGISGNLISVDESGELNRLGSTFTNNPNTFATFQLVAFCMALWLFLYLRKPFFNKIIYLVAAVLDLIAIFLSGSRKAIVAAAVFFAILFFLKKDDNGRKKYIRNIILIIFVLLISWNVLMSNQYLYEIAGERLEQLIEQLLGNSVAIVGSSSYLRSEYRKIAFEGWLKSPIWGHGFDSFHLYNSTITGRDAYSHNNFTELLYNGGIIAFFLFYSFHIKILWSALKSFNNQIKSLIIASIVCFLIFDYGQVDYNSTVVIMFLCLLSKIMQYADIEEYENIN